MKNLLLSILAAASFVIPTVASAVPVNHQIPAATAAIDVCGMPDDANFQAVVFANVSYNLALQNDNGDYQLKFGDVINLAGDTLTITHNLDQLPQVCKDALADEEVDVNVNISLVGPNAGLWVLSTTILNDTTLTVADLTGQASNDAILAPVQLSYAGPLAQFVDASPTLQIDGQISADIPSDSPVNTTIFAP